MEIITAESRGHTDIDWLDSKHSFSFGSYYDPARTGFRSLRVINDDIIGAGGGFDTHPHRDMEIVTIPFSGTLMHRDSLGSGGALQFGDIQVMTAGRGILHSEFNGSKTDPARIIQIWIQPERRGLPPTYSQERIPVSEHLGKFKVVVGQVGVDEAPLTINQQARILRATLIPGKELTHSLPSDRYGWLQVATGSLEVEGAKLKEGDAVTFEPGSSMTLFSASEGAELILFELA